MKYLIILLLLSACAPRPQWPAYLTGMTDLTDTEKQEVYTSIDLLNDKAIEPVIVAPRERGYPILITKLTSSQENGRLLGIAWRSELSCKIGLSKRVFQADASEYLTSVVWHELGHCAGLNHVDDANAIMYPYSAPFKYYSPITITTFVQDLYNSTRNHE